MSKGGATPCEVFPDEQRIRWQGITGLKERDGHTYWAIWVALCPPWSSGAGSHRLTWESNHRFMEAEPLHSPVDGFGGIAEFGYVFG